MNTSIVKKEFWKSDEYIELHLDTKIIYLYLLTCPDKGYLNVFKFNKHLATLCTGISNNSIDAGMEQLKNKQFIDVYNGYVGLLKGDVTNVGGQYGGVNKERELASLPVDVRDYFDLDSTDIPDKTPAKKIAKKAGPAPETIKDIIGKQPREIQESLRNFVEDRIERKKAPTTRAVKGWINKLEKMYPGNPSKQALSLDQSIERGWMGLFEVKVDNDRKSESREFM